MAHTSWVCLRGAEQQYFSTASLCFMQPLPHQACLVLLQQEICSSTFLLQYSVYAHMHVCVCACIHSEVKHLPPTDTLLFSCRAWSNGFIVCFELRNRRWAATTPQLMKSVRVFICSCRLTKPFFFLYEGKPETQVSVTIYYSCMYRHDFTRVLHNSSTHNYSLSGRYRGRLIFGSHILSHCRCVHVCVF